MWIQQLCITGLRNLVSVDMCCARRINVLCGVNGSGKTSILESIYYFAYARSFRTRIHHHVINYEANSFLLFAQFQEGDCQTSVGIERHRRDAMRIHIASEEAKVVQLAKLLPLHVINSESYLLLTAGSVLRRQFIDWALFHVEPSFLSNWRYAQRVIRQRNRLLKLHPLDCRQLASWDSTLIELANKLSTSRRQCIEKLMAIFVQIWQDWDVDKLPKIEWHFYSGWPSKQTLGASLERSLEQDRKLGYTQYGPHRADLVLSINGMPVQNILSRGQQKLLLYALKLAQGQLLQHYKQQPCIYLLDDLPSELDREHRNLLMHALDGLSAQVFITATSTKQLSYFLECEYARLFKIDHGVLTLQGA